MTLARRVMDVFRGVFVDAFVGRSSRKTRRRRPQQRRLGLRGFEPLEERTLLAVDLYGSTCYAPRIAQWGEAISVQPRIANGGTSASEPFQVQWYLSKDSIGSGDDTLLSQTNGASSYSHAGIGAYAWVTRFTVSLLLPPSLPSGWSGTSFYVIQKTDSADQVTESNEKNNFGQRGDWRDRVPITIKAPVQYPDLQGLICYVNNSNSAQWGQPINVQAQIRNAGAGAAKAFEVAWYLSKDAIGSSDDIPLSRTSGAGNSYSHAGIAANSYGSSFTVNLQLPPTLPWGWSGTSFYIVQKTDSARQVDEGSKEDNNFGQIGAWQDRCAITINAPVQYPDLLGWGCYATDSAQWGQVITVLSGIRNAGAGAARAFQVEWYLSEDSTGSDDDDIPLFQTNGLSSYGHGSIAANSSGPQFSVNLKLPPALPQGWSGTSFFIVMWTDRANDVPEGGNEGNNFGVAPMATIDWDNVTITAPLSPVVKLPNVPFVSQYIDGTENHLCQFACAAMLLGQQYGTDYATKAVMQDLSREAGKGDLAKPAGATLDETTAAVTRYMAKKGITTSITSGSLPYGQIKQALRNGRAVSVALLYESLGSARADWYKKETNHTGKDRFVGNHQVVVIGFDEIKGEWTLFDPLQPAKKETTVSSKTFEEAVLANKGHSDAAWGWYLN